MRWLAACLIVFSCGCASISESTRNVDHPVRSYEKRTEAKEWLYFANGRASPDDGEKTITLAFDVERYRSCTTEQHTIVRRQKVTTRTFNRDIYVYSAIGLLGVAGGVALVASADSAPDEATTGSDELTKDERRKYGWTLIGVGAVVAAVPVLNEFRAGESVADAGEIDEAKPRIVQKCHAARAAGVEVALWADGGGGLLTKGTTDASGRFVAKVSAEDVVRLGPRYHVSVAGRPAGTTLALEAVHDQTAHATRQDRARAIVDEELKTGRCHQSKVDALHDVLAGVRHAFQNWSGSELFDVVGHTLVVAKDGGTPVELTSGLGGEYHVLAFQYTHSLKLEVEDQQGYAVNERSAFGEGVAQLFTPIGWDSRVVQVNARKQIPITVHGLGCTLVIAVRKY